MENFPKDVLGIIVSHFDTRELIKLRQLSKRWKELIEQVIEFHPIYCNNKLCDEYMYILRNAKNIYMKLCRQVSDVGMLQLEKVERLNASGCYQLTNAAFGHLKHLVDVNLSGCYQLTDKVLNNFSKVKYLDISYCNKITATGLSYLTNNPTVVIKGCPLISEKEKLKHIQINEESDERVLHDPWKYQRTFNNEGDYSKVKILDTEESKKYDNARCILFNKVNSTSVAERDLIFMKNYKSLLPHPKLLDYPDAIKRLQTIPHMKLFIDNLRKFRIDALLAGSTGLSCVYREANFKPNDIDLYVKDINKEKLCLIEKAIYKTFEFCYIVVVRGSVTMTWYIQQKNSDIIKIQVNLLRILTWPEVLVTCHTDLTCLGFEVKTLEFIYLEGRWNRILTDSVHYFTNILNMDNQQAIYYSVLKYSSRGFSCSMSPLYCYIINRIDEFKAKYFQLRIGHMSDTPRENISSNSLLDHLRKYGNFLDAVKFSSTVHHLFGDEIPVPVLCLSVYKINEYAMSHPNDEIFQKNLKHAQRYLNLHDVPPLPSGKFYQNEGYYDVGVQCPTCFQYYSLKSYLDYGDDACDHIFHSRTVPEIILI